MTGSTVIRQARAMAGLSQRELADRLATKQSVVARWESGVTSPSVNVVNRVAAACGLNLDWALSAIDPDLERNLREQLQRSPAARIASVVELVNLFGA